MKSCQKQRVFIPFLLENEKKCRRHISLVFFIAGYVKRIGVRVPKARESRDVGVCLEIINRDLQEPQGWTLYKILDFQKVFQKEELFEHNYCG